MSAPVISLYQARQRLKSKREQAFIEACERELEIRPVMSIEELVSRAKARVRGEAQP